MCLNLNLKPFPFILSVIPYFLFLNLWRSQGFQKLTFFFYKYKFQQRLYLQNYNHLDLGFKFVAKRNFFFLKNTLILSVSVSRDTTARGSTPCNPGLAHQCPKVVQGLRNHNENKTSQLFFVLSQLNTFVNFQFLFSLIFYRNYCNFFKYYFWRDIPTHLPTLSLT